MGVLDRKIIVEINLDDGTIINPKNVSYYITDKNIANIYIKLKRTENSITKYILKDDADYYTVKLNIVLPKTLNFSTIVGKFEGDTDNLGAALYRFELENKYVKQDGKVICEPIIVYNEEEITIDYFAYDTKLPKTSEYNIALIIDPDMPILKSLIQEVKETVQAVNNIDNNNVSDTKTYSSEKIEEKFTDVNSQITERAKNFYILRKRLAVETNDTQAFKDAIEESYNGSTILVNRDVLINEKIALSNRNINGKNYTFSCGTDGLDYQFEVSGNAKIENCKVDSLLKGRGFVTVSNSDMFIAENLQFTGYSKDYGYYKTDAGICLNANVRKASIINCLWKNWGDQYDTTTSDLNRCITINDSIDDVHIENCSFISVNQAIVNAGKNLKVVNNVFESVNDNGLYLFGENAYIQNNTFRNMNDEVIVMSGGNYFINNNTFNNWSNKAIAFCGNTNFVIIANNTFLSNMDNSQFIITRDKSYHIKKIFIDNNIFQCDFPVTNNYDWISLGSCIEVKFNNNNLIVNHTDPDKYIITSIATIVSLFNNSFTSSQADGTRVINNSKADSTILHGNNYVKNCRISLKGNKMGDVQSNVPYYIGNNANKFAYCVEKPTWDFSEFNKGDIIINKTVDTDIKNGDVMGWYFDGESLNPLAMPPQTHTGSPVNNKRPRYIGDMCVDITNSEIYMAINTDIDGWVKINS